MNSLFVSHQHRLAALTEKVKNALCAVADKFKPLNLNAFTWAMAPQSVRYVTLLVLADQKPDLGLGGTDARRAWADFTADQQITLSAYMGDLYNDYALWAGLQAEAQGYFDSYREGVNARRDAELRQELAELEAKEAASVRAAA